MMTSKNTHRLYPSQHKKFKIAFRFRVNMAEGLAHTKIANGAVSVQGRLQAKTQ